MSIEIIQICCTRCNGTGSILLPTPDSVISEIPPISYVCPECNGDCMVDVAKERSENV